MPREHGQVLSIHLYTAALDDIDTAASRRRCEALLSPAERAKRDAFAFDRNRREYLFAHAMKRKALSKHAPTIPPEAWSFMVAEHGRPEVAGPPGITGLHFNLSHTDGFVACIVASRPCIGVDVEVIDREELTRDDAAQIFAAAELTAARSLTHGHRRRRLFEYWTLKEAYLKARGLGLSVALDSFWFLVNPPDPPAISFGAAFDDDAARWRFALRAPTERHQLAIAAGEATDILIVDEGSPLDPSSRGEPS
jgi:4'-phosphopantetheinyl transferase